MDISADARDRINSAADALYEGGGRRVFPTVDAVRKLARVNMNDASNGMRAWRRTQSAQVAPMAVQVPNALQLASATALNALWTEAVTMANETLRAAQTGWDAERTEGEALSEQMANAYEAQATELASAQAEIVRRQLDLEHLNEALAAIQQRADQAILEAAAANAATSQAAARAIEIERRADDLRQELDHAHAAIATASTERAVMRRAHGDEIAGLRAELAETRQRSELKEATARAELRQALEEAATLRGRLGVLTEPQAPAGSKPRSKGNPDGEMSK